MKKFIYEISNHRLDEFTRVGYFCTSQGECSIEDVPADQAGKLAALLNERGAEGWELLQLVFGRDGLLAFWKKEAVEQ